MAEVQQNTGGNGKGKNHQKKMTIRVDFTPMVDMNMLLITFFMLCTTMIKSQTLNIALPSNEKVENEENMSQASEKDAITIIVDAKKKKDASGHWVVDSLNHEIQNAVYYYEGKPGDGNGNLLGAANNLKESQFLEDNSDISQGIRKIIQEKNKDVWKQIQEKKKDFRDGKIKSQAEFDSIAKTIRNNKDLSRPVVIIKATPQASYGTLVQILDEMQINQIARYQIDNLTDADEVLLSDYLQNHAK